MRARFICMAAGLLALLGMVGCPGGSGGPRPGDTVTPELQGVHSWTAGQPAGIAARLRAQGLEDASPRLLGFVGIPSDVNPVATVTFYEGEAELEPVEVALSHRC